MNVPGFIYSIAVAIVMGIFARAAYGQYAATGCIFSLTGSIIFTGVSVMLALVAISYAVGDHDQQ